MNALSEGLTFLNVIKQIIESLFFALGSFGVVILYSILTMIVLSVVKVVKWNHGD